MKKVLICPITPIEAGYRVVEVSNESFEVALPLFWIDYPETIEPTKYWFDPSDNSLKEIPEVIEDIIQPVTTGSQEL
jgi:hypothetical protein